MTPPWLRSFVKMVISAKVFNKFSVLWNWILIMALTRAWYWVLLEPVKSWRAEWQVDGRKDGETSRQTEIRLGWDKDILPNKLDFTVKSSEHETIKRVGSTHSTSLQLWTLEQNKRSGCSSGTLYRSCKVINVAPMCRKGHTIRNHARLSMALLKRRQTARRKAIISGHLVYSWLKSIFARPTGQARQQLI
jgi:hypothetical protein